MQQTADKWNPTIFAQTSDLNTRARSHDFCNLAITQCPLPAASKHVQGHATLVTKAAQLTW